MQQQRAGVVARDVVQEVQGIMPQGFLLKVMLSFVCSSPKGTPVLMYMHVEIYALQYRSALVFVLCHIVYTMWHMCLRPLSHWLLWFKTANQSSAHVEPSLHTSSKFAHTSTAQC